MVNIMMMIVGLRRIESRMKKFMKKRRLKKKLRRRVTKGKTRRRRMKKMRIMKKRIRIASYHH